MDDMTNPGPEVIDQDVADQDAPESADEGQAQDLSFDSSVTEDDVEEAGETQADDSEDVDYEGKQYKVPKEIKEALLRQADYTRKTQEVAEHRRSLEAEREQFHQQARMHQATLQDNAHLMIIDQQLKQFEQLDWDKVIEEDPLQAMKLQRQLDSLKGAREQAVTRITQFQQQQFQTQQAELAKRMESGNAELKKEIANWSPEFGKELKKYGIEKLGFTDKELSSVIDPRNVKVLHKAYLYDQLLRKQAVKPPVEPQKPITTVKAKTSTATKDPGKMTDSEFAAWRKRQIAQRS